MIGLGVFSQAQSRRAAILLTGHVRTFDLTAPTLDEFLILFYRKPRSNGENENHVDGRRRPHQFPADRADEVFLVPPQPRVLDGPPHHRETLE